MADELAQQRARVVALLTPIASTAAIATPRLHIPRHRSGWARVTLTRTSPEPVLTIPLGRLRSLDDDALRGVLAHEVAHIAAGHVHRSPLPGPLQTDRRISLTLGGTAAIAALLPLVLGATLGLHHTHLVQLVLCAVALAVAASLPWLLVIHRCPTPPGDPRDRELSADAMAVALVGPDAVTAFLNTIPGSPLPWPKSSRSMRVVGGHSTHPPTATRLAAVRNLSAAG